MSRRAKPSPHRGVRIIGGRWRGRRLKLPEGATARPTPDRVRETLFNWLAEPIVGARCLDLYAGSGILGLEALSRGAEDVKFVEADRRLTAALASELAALGCRARVFTEQVERFLARPPSVPADVVFLDPPYEFDLASMVERVAPHIGPAALIYIERAAADGLPELSGFDWLKTSRAGAVRYGLARRTDGA